MLTQAEAPEIRIEAPEDLAGVAARISRLDRARLRAIVRLVGLTDPGDPITVLLVPEGSDLANATPPWIVGFARGADSPIVLFPARSPSYPYDSLDDVLQHEIAHVLIERAAAEQRVPRWFHEGLALSAERPWGFEDRTRVAFALAGRGVSADALDRSFVGGRSEQARAYAISGAWMRDIVRRHGSDAPARILRQMAAGRPFDEAFVRTTGETVTTSAAIFWRDSWWYQAVPFFTSSLVLWIAVTFLALYAIRTRRARRAARWRAWEAEERQRAEEPQRREEPPEDDRGDPEPTVH